MHSEWRRKKHHSTVVLSIGVVVRVLVEPPEVMNPQREVFCSKLSPTRRRPREIERKLQADPTQVIEKVDSGLREIVSLLEDLSAIEQVSW